MGQEQRGQVDALLELEGAQRIRVEAYVGPSGVRAGVGHLLVRQDGRRVGGDRGRDAGAGRTRHQALGAQNQPR